VRASYLGSNHNTIWKEYRNAHAPLNQDKPKSTLEEKIDRLKQDPQLVELPRHHPLLGLIRYFSPVARLP
jgi:hypothetical protein